MLNKDCRFRSSHGYEPDRIFCCLHITTHLKKQKRLIPESKIIHVGVEPTFANFLKHNLKISVFPFPITFFFFWKYSHHA